MDHRIKLAATFIIGLISTASIAAAHHAPHLTQPLEFKTLVLGAPTTPAQVEAVLTTPCGMKGGTCDALDKKMQEDRKVTCGLGGGGVQVCNGSTTIADTIAEVNVVIGADGILQRIHLTFSNLGYDANDCKGSVSDHRERTANLPVGTLQAKVADRPGAVGRGFHKVAE